MDEHTPGTREELRQLLEDAGLDSEEARRWLDFPSGRLSGLVPSEAIADPAQSHRVWEVAQRFIDGRHDPVPELVHVTEVRILEPGTHLVELRFEWDGGTEVRVMDLRPYLFGPAFERVRTDYAAFAQLYVDVGTVCWPGDLDLAPELLYAESEPSTRER